MALSEAAAVDLTKRLIKVRSSECTRLDKIHDYLRDDPDKRLGWLPSDVPLELHRLARISRVNVVKFVVNSRVQSMYVDGFRTPRASEDVPAWDIWQQNRFDARQIGVHRAALSYGASYVTVLPGDPVPVMRGASPRNMTVAYGADDDWPEAALEKRRVDVEGRHINRLIDDEAVYLMACDSMGSEARFLGLEEHDAGVTPVVRYKDTEDLDDPVIGIVEPLLNLQDQINITSFALHVAQHYGAFRQRYVIGWLAESEEQKLKASASKLWTFEDQPGQVQVGEFSQTDLKGYIDSREATLKHLSTVSQTPAHELLGQLVNMSAEALAAAEASKQRAVVENRVVLGESHEQTLNLGSEMNGGEVEPSAEVVWRDTESRALAQVVDALVKLVQGLGVPPQELWEMIPNVSQSTVERWKAAAAEGDALANLTSMLDRQAEPAEEPAA